MHTILRLRNPLFLLLITNLLVLFSSSTFIKVRTFQNEEATSLEKIEQSTCSLENLFKKFCSQDKDGMSRKEYLKFNKDCGLLDKNFTSTDADVFFGKVKEKIQKFINYDGFNEAVRLTSIKKGLEYEELIQKACQSCNI
jgi:hypothetical protein